MSLGLDPEQGVAIDRLAALGPDLGVDHIGAALVSHLRGFGLLDAPAPASALDPLAAAASTYRWMAEGWEKAGIPRD